MNKQDFYRLVGRVANKTNSPKIGTAVKLHRHGYEEEALELLNAALEIHSLKKNMSLLETRYGLMRKLAKEAVTGRKTTFEDYTGGRGFVTDDGYSQCGEADAAGEDFMAFSKELDVLRKELAQEC